MDAIGCKERDQKALADDAAKVERCTSFLGLLLDAANRVETVRNHCSVVTECALLGKTTRRDGDRLREVLEAGEPSAFAYLELGELSKAMRAARIYAEVDQPDEAHGDSPYDPLPPVHLSDSRIELYVSDDRDLLGTETLENMAAHIRGCKVCEHAVQRRRTVVGSR